MSDIMMAKEYFIKAVSACINDTDLVSLPDEVNFNDVYKLAERNCAQIMLFSALQGKEQPQKEAFAKLALSCQTNVVREMNQQAELKAIRAQFHEANIDFMLLKGSHLKELYPIPEMRFMVDMDILVKPDDVQEAEKIILSHGLRREMNNGKDIVLIKKPFLTIELHNTLFVEENSMFSYFLSVWKKAVSVADNEYKMSDNDLYIYTMAHLAEHYTSAGSCFRPVIDIYLMNKKLSASLDFDYINSEFRKIDILEFAENIKQLGKCWFEQAQKDDTLLLMENYIIFGAPVKSIKVVGDSTNEGKSKISIMFASAFPGFKHMALLFPILNKLPFLLPVFWVIRIFKHLFTKETKNKLEEIKHADMNDIKKMNDIYKKSGL